jgi:DNA-binding PadR family transcriptional regulator
MHRHWRRHHRWHGHGPGFWGRQGRFFDAGEVRLALLSLLGERPMHGYELMKQLEARSGGTYRASAGTVYPTLQQLEDEGLVAVAEENGKRVYRITDAGRALLAEEAASVRRIWDRAEEWGDWEAAYDPGAWEVARPAMRLVKRAFRAVTHGADPDAVREILARAEGEIGELERRAR